MCLFVLHLTPSLQGLHKYIINVSFDHLWSQAARISRMHLFVCLQLVECSDVSPVPTYLPGAFWADAGRL